MLKVKSIAKAVPTKIEMDIYVPLNIEWIHVNPTNDRIIYWRTGDFNKSLLELGISKKNNCICSLTLTLIEKINLDSFQQLNPVSVTDGIPIFGLNNLTDSDHIDECRKFDVYFNEKCLDIVFTGEIEYTHILKSDRVKFVLNQKQQLCMIRVDELFRNEIETLRISFNL